MADIFISYSKADHDKVVTLAAYLESQGWTVWWDTNLAAGDTFRDEIMTQLAAARAVIVLWSRNSIRSDFVRAEAGRAKADGKLIPVKQSDVAYADIPLPFGEMHTEEISKRELIRAAIVAQLARPLVPPSALWLTTKTFRYQVLTWTGIVGGAITLFTNLQGILNLADWARWLVENWHDWTLAFWNLTLGWMGIPVPQEWLPLLSLTMFCLMTAFGSKAYVREAGVKLLALQRAKEQIIGSTIFAALFVGLSVAWYVVYYADILPQNREGVLTDVVLLIAAATLSIAILFIWHKEDAWHSALFMALFGCFFFIIFIQHGDDAYVSVTELAARYLHQHRLISSLPEPLGSSIVLTIVSFGFYFIVYIFPLAMLEISSIEALVRRFLFLFVGLLLLLAFNQLSYYASDIRALLRPPHL